MERPYSEQLQTTVTGTNHTVITSDNRIIHHKLIRSIVKSSEQGPFNRGTEPRGTDRKFSRKVNKDPTTPERSLLQDDPTDTIPD